MPGSSARNVLASLQQLEPQPATTRVPEGGPSPLDPPFDWGEPSPQTPWAGASPAATAPAVLGDRCTVPVNASRASQTMSTSTSSAATGAIGTQLVRRLRIRRTCHSIARQCQAGASASGAYRAAAVVTPYQVRAFSSPASAATARNSATSSRGDTTATADSSTKPPSSQPAVPAAGSRR